MHYHSDEAKKGSVDRNNLKVVAAAILDCNSKIIYTLPPPKRHCHVIMYMVDTMKIPAPVGNRPNYEQGFILNDGRFVMRKAAAQVARRNGQLPEGKKVSPHGLFSEDLW